MGVSKGLGPLGVYANTEEGVSFQTDNEMYWSSYCNGMTNRLQAREEKDATSKFLVFLLQNGKIVLQDFREMYISWTVYDGITYLEMGKSFPDELCEFEVFHDGEKVMFKASNGKFVCRTFHNHETILEVSRTKVVDCCRFRAGMGDLYKPCFDITAVEWDDISNLAFRPCVIKAEKFLNRTNEDQEHEFMLTWETKTSETTQWARTWGLNSMASTKFPLMAFEATITYNGSFQKTAITHRLINESRNVKVSVPPRHKVYAQLMVSKMENVSVPFKVHVRKIKVDGDVLNLVEDGVWKGLVYSDITVATTKQPLSFFDCLFT
ncbi:uncharacterized protein LOC134572690 [Pelobates fuscus]|uniref:uncharacterized protein LOC134572690 n=1 Tax=Pelobates fuscus TaxID=191477 RepID=UPI002FE4F34C